MWISKKKYELEQRKLKNDAFLESLKGHEEDDQWDRIRKLEKQVKKLKKIVKQGY